MSEWKEVSIDEIKSNSKNAIAIGPFGSRLKSENYVSEGIPVIRGTNVSSSKVFSGNFVFITKEMAKSLGSANVYPGDLVFPHRGAIGEVGIVDSIGLSHYVISSSLMKLTPDTEKVIPDYLFYFFKTKIGKNELLKNASTVGTPGIGQPLSSLKSIKLNLPPLLEQKSIAHILGSLDDKIELNRQMNQTLEAMAQALFKSWFVDFDPVMDNALAAGNDIPDELQAMVEKRRVIANREVRSGKQSHRLINTNPELAAKFPSSFVFIEKLGKWIPDGWEVKTIDRVTSLIIDHRGKTPTKLGGDWADKGFPAISAKNIKDGKLIRHDMIRFVNDKLYSKWMREPIQKGDIIMTSEAPMGEMFFVADDTPFCLSQRLYGIRANGVDSTPIFLYNWLQTDIAKGDLEGRSTGTTVTGIKQSELRKVIVLSPSIHILEEYEIKIDPIFSRINTNNKETETLTQLRNNLLPELISGRVRVPEKVNY